MDIKQLGLQARQHRLATKASYDSLYAWFMTKASPFRRVDLLKFDSWLRSHDGVTPGQVKVHQQRLYPLQREMSVNSPRDMDFDQATYMMIPFSWSHNKNDQFKVHAWTVSLEGIRIAANI